MLEKLQEHSSLGKPRQLTKIIELLTENTYSKADLKFACSNIDYSFNKDFEGAIFLLSWLDIIEISNPIKIKKKLNLQKIELNLCHLILQKLSKVHELHNLINDKNLLLDSLFIVKSNSIPGWLSPIRNILMLLGFFEVDQLINNHYNIGSSYTDWFKATGIDLIESSKKKNFSLDALLKIQEKKSIVGFEAEKFVLKYELTSRKKHPMKHKISIISEDNASAGYDIDSYNSDDSIILDKYIEVKSYSQAKYGSENPDFYWSINEAETAKKEKENYCLYLVDRDQMNNKNYKPIIISNPYEKVFNSDKWEMEAQNWKFKEVS